MPPPIRAVPRLPTVTTAITATVVSTREYDVADRLITSATDGNERAFWWSDARERLPEPH